jgi:hypothetical protein
MSPGMQTLLNVLCTVLSLGIAWACMCRLAAGNGEVWAGVRLHASVGFGAGLLSAAAPWLGYPATWGQVMLAMTIAVGMLASVWRWRGGIDDGLIRSEPATERYGGTE